MGVYQSQIESGTVVSPTDPQARLAHSPHQDGVNATTRVATPYGWRAAASLSQGDEVFAQDGSLSTVRGVEHYGVPLHGAHNLLDSAFVFCPVGALGNQQPMTLTARQRLVLPVHYMGPYEEERGVLVAAIDLVGLNGIAISAPDPDEATVILRFGSDRGIMAGQGALLWCTGVDVRFPDAVPAARAYRAIEAGSFRDEFPGANAQHLLDRIAEPWV